MYAKIKVNLNLDTMETGITHNTQVKSVIEFTVDFGLLYRKKG